MVVVVEASPARSMLRLWPDILPGFRLATLCGDGAEADAGMYYRVITNGKA